MEVSMSNKRYTEEFKREAVRQVTERGYTAKSVADRLGVSAHTLYKWVKDASPNPAPAGDADLRSEVARLKAELRRVQEERDILKKAAAYFAKAAG
jgi:transposase